MNYQLLFGEINDPAYAGMTDAEIVDALNATAQARRSVPVAALYATALATGAYTAIDLAAHTSQHPELAAAARTVLSLLGGMLPAVDLDSPAAQQMFGTLAQAGVINQQQAAAIQALADYTTPSRAAELGLGAVTVEDVEAARDWHAAQEAETARLAAFAALQERLVNGYHSGLAWLAGLRDGGQAAPGWDAVVGRM